MRGHACAQEERQGTAEKKIGTLHVGKNTPKRAPMVAGDAALSHPMARAAIVPVFIGRIDGADFASAVRLS
ncbi:hypothetical protein GCM10009087_26590 [Sphingomonas oligophenolica]